MNDNLSILHTNEKEFPLWQKYYNMLANKGIYHSPEYIKYLEKYHQNEAELFIFADGENFIYYPYFKKRLDKLPFAEECKLDLSKYYDIVSSWYYGGPIFSDRYNKGFMEESLAKGFVESFGDHCRDNHIVSEFVRFDPNIENHKDFLNILPIKFNRETIYVDLTLSESEIWSGYRGRCRTAVRKGKKYPVEVSKVEAVEFVEVFSPIYQAEMMRKSAPSHYLFSRDFFAELIGSLKEITVAFMVFYEGRPVGGTICLIEKEGVAYDYLTATNPDYWKYQVNNLLLHEVILWCKKAGAVVYDFHGGRDSVAFFKASFSSLRRSFYVAGVIHNREMYDRLIVTKERLGFERTQGYFPEYRVKDTN